MTNPINWLEVLISGLPGVLIALAVPYVLERKKEWRECRYSLLLDFKQLYSEVENISKKPNLYNGYSFQVLFKAESIILRHYAKCFFLKRKKLTELAEKMRRIQSDILLVYSYEELLLSKGESSPVFKDFLRDVNNRIQELISLLLFL